MKNTTLALSRLIHQVREQRTSSVMDLKESNSSLFDSFSSALYYFLMPPAKSARTGALLAALREEGMSPEDCMSDTWLWLFSEFTGKSRKFSGRLRIDVILDAQEDYLMPTFYLSVNNHLCDLLKKKSPSLVSFDTPVTGTDSLTVADLLSDDTRLMENASALLRETDTISEVLKSNLSAPEKLCILLVSMGYEMPKSIQAFAREVSPDTLRTILLANCPSLSLDSDCFPLEEALCELKQISSARRISELKRAGIRALHNNDFRHHLLAC